MALVHITTIAFVSALVIVGFGWIAYMLNLDIL